MREGAGNLIWVINFTDIVFAVMGSLFEKTFGHLGSYSLFEKTFGHLGSYRIVAKQVAKLEVFAEVLPRMEQKTLSPS
jgi:hypothetical protein